MADNSLRQLYDALGPAVIDKWEQYIDIYEVLFAPLRSEPISILEIGVFKGGSLSLWRQYFNCARKVVGVDIDESARQFDTSEITIRIGDQSDPEFLGGIIQEFGGFDVVIDDGGHRWGSQKTSFEILYGSTKNLYIVEDTHTSLWEKFNPSGEQTNFIEFAKQKIEFWRRPSR